MAPRTEPITVPIDAAGDIHGTLTLPDAAPTGVVVVHPATATPHRFYTGFAEHAARRGLAVVTYDYRSTGVSGDPRKFRQLRMRDWIQTDASAVTAHAAALYPGLPVYAVGHSIGGHALVMGYGEEHLTRAVVVASHLAATRTLPHRGERFRVWVLLQVVGPTLARVRGFVGASRVGLGEDLPAGVVLEWSAWSRKARYFYDDPTMDGEARAARVRVPLFVISASDDIWSTPGQIDALVAPLTGTQVTRRHVTPASLGARKVGHHGLMRRGVGEPVWNELLDWLQRG